MSALSRAHQWRADSPWHYIYEAKARPASPRRGQGCQVRFNEAGLSRLLAARVRDSGYLAASGRGSHLAATPVPRVSVAVVPAGTETGVQDGSRTLPPNAVGQCPPLGGG